MLGIYAKSFMTATRSGCTRVYDVQAKPKGRRWLPAGHWWFDRSRCVDLDRLGPGATATARPARAAPA